MRPLSHQRAAACASVGLRQSTCAGSLTSASCHTVRCLHSSPQLDSTVWRPTRSANATHMSSSPSLSAFRDSEVFPRRRFTMGGRSSMADGHEVIQPDEIDVIEAPPVAPVAPQSNFNASGGTHCFQRDADRSSSSSVSAASTAWQATLSPELPTAFTEVLEIDAFARSRMLSFVRRHAADAKPEGTRAASSSAFETTTFTSNDSEVFHARLQLPLTPAAVHLLRATTAAHLTAETELWAHGVSNTAKDAEMLAAMHAERLADLLDYCVYTLPSGQRKHAAAARLAGRYAPSPDVQSDSIEAMSLSAEERVHQWPLPLRRVLSDEETEGGRYQLVDTSSSIACCFICPSHTILSPCLLDALSRTRLETRFRDAPPSCPSFVQQLRVEKVSTLTASTANTGGSHFLMASLTLPTELTSLSEMVVAEGKAEDRSTAVLLACMHAELLLDALHVPLFTDSDLQKQHALAAWSYGRPAPLPGVRPKVPSHVHLPDPLKQVVAANTNGKRTAPRSPEEEWFHQHEMVAAQTDTFVETTVAEGEAIEMLNRFLADHGAPRPTAAFLRSAVGSRFKSTVVLPLPAHYGIRGSVGIAATSDDADALAAMHALDILCMLGVAVLPTAELDAAWKTARRAQVPNVPALNTEAAAPSPPARRCSGKRLSAVVTVKVETAPTGTDESQKPTRKRVIKRARRVMESGSPDTSASPQATHASSSEVESPSAPTDVTQNTLKDVEGAIARLMLVRTAVDKEYWDLTADSPDGYLMIAPGAVTSSVAVEWAITSPRKLDKNVKSRIIEYLSSVGRRLDEVIVKQSLSAEDADSRQRFRCALKLPLPSVCGGPRLALGEADTIGEAEHVACMHAELLLDALGVCLFTDVVKQQRHAEACAQRGRWAPSAPGQERSTANTATLPPPLRREHASSLHWARKMAVKSSAEVALPPSACAAVPEIEETAESVAQFEYIDSEDIDPVAKARVQYYLRHEHLTTQPPRLTCTMVRNAITHFIEFELPISSRFLEKSEIDHDKYTTRVETCTVKGGATTRKDADALAWMHAERLLDAIGVPLFPNLLQLQAYHIAQARAQGRLVSPVLDCLDAAKEVRLPLASILPKPLRLGLGNRRQRLSYPPMPSEAEATSEVEWNTYVITCESYILAAQLQSHMDFFNQSRVPRTGDPTVDAALDEAESAPLLANARVVLHLYAVAAHFTEQLMWTTSVGGDLQHRVLYVTARVPGFPYVLARGVGFSKTVAQHRAVMHALALLRRLDPDYEDHYSTARRMEKASANGDGGADNDDDFDLDTFNTLPMIGADVHRMAAGRKRLQTRFLRQLFDGAVSYDRPTESFSDVGRRRILAMYALCCAVNLPVEQTLVRLLPRHEDALATKDEVSTVVDASLSRVASGATFTTSLAMTDEEGKVWTARCSGEGPHENTFAAYESLLRQIELHVPLVQQISTLLRRHVFLRPETTPLVEFPEAVLQRARDCLSSQQDLLEREDASGETDAAKVAEVRRTMMNRRSCREMAEEKDDSDDNTIAAQSERKAVEIAATEAEESALLLEQLQKRMTSPEYLDKYAARRATLRIADHKAELHLAIATHPVVIICGTTGCGKTTQIPQYLLDAATQNGHGGSCRVVVTQPRRLSTIAVAKRVAAERLEQVGASTGYVVRFDSKMGKHINFMTVGILLRSLQGDPDLSNVTHIIVDEIHERDLFSDFLLILLRDLIKRRPELRLILMSATLQASDFQRYFDGAPLIQVEGYSFPVKELFLEDLVPYAEEHKCMTPLLTEASQATKTSFAAATEALMPVEASSRTDSGARYGLLAVTSDVDYPTMQFAIEQAIRLIDLQNSSVLVFLPGWAEIVHARGILERRSDYHVLTLHSSMTQEAQMRCFLPSPEGKIKIILSTNIAESGVTIDDVGAVIDTGRAKEMSYMTRSKQGVRPAAAPAEPDANKTTMDAPEEERMMAPRQFSQLVEVYASRANCVQRRGRVGRTRPGVCIRLYSRTHFAQLHEYQTPQMLRTPLDTLCLSILYLQVGNPATFLNSAVEAPDPAEVAAAMQRLFDLGAVTEHHRLTPLGARLAQLPVEPEIGKTILLGVAMRCLDTALTIVALSQVDVFVRNQDERPAVRMHRQFFANKTNSDLIASVNAYNFWATTQRYDSAAAAAQDLQNHQLSVPQLMQISRFKWQFFSLLVDSGFLPKSAMAANNHVEGEMRGLHGPTLVFVDRSEWSRNALDVGVVKSVIAGSTLPNLCVAVGEKAAISAQHNTLVFSGDSVLQQAELTRTSNPFVVFRDISRFSAIRTLRIQGLTSVSIWAVLLMGTEAMKIDYLHDLSLGVVENWAYFRASFQTALQIRKLRTLLNRRFNRKCVKPDDEVNNKQLDELCGIIAELMHTPMHPNSLLPNSVVWSEEGQIIDPLQDQALKETKEAEPSSEGRQKAVEAERVV